MGASKAGAAVQSEEETLLQAQARRGELKFGGVRNLGALELMVLGALGGARGPDSSMKVD